MIGTAIGNYVVQSKLGEGGMGAVYLAEHARLGKRVVVKVLLPELARSKDVVARFFNEAKAATDIKNEHIVDVLDFGELPDGTSYIVMEWLEGQSLADLVRGGPIPVARTLHIAQGMSQALGAAHARGIVHRDLKPDNVFLVSRSGDPDFVKVLDFGIAKLSSNAGDVHTRTGAVMGTPLYMSPEQINGVNVDHRTDIYAMGIIVYQMLTGSLPFETTTLTELLLAHATKTPPPLRQRDASIPVEVEAAVMRALEKDPARRFESTEAFVSALASPAAPRVDRRSAVVRRRACARALVVVEDADDRHRRRWRFRGARARGGRRGPLANAFLHELRRHRFDADHHDGGDHHVGDDEHIRDHRERRAHLHGLRRPLEARQERLPARLRSHARRDHA
jgi:serine/threonine protein kinase